VSVGCLLILVTIARDLGAQEAAPQQPVPFSHKIHTAAAKLVCQDCHPAPAKFGAEMGFPAASKCMSCHVLIAKDKPAIRKLAEFAASKQAVRGAMGEGVSARRLRLLRPSVSFDQSGEV
jgi:hypothetical protein